MANVAYTDVEIRRGAANIYDFVGYPDPNGRPIVLGGPDDSWAVQCILDLLGAQVLYIPPRRQGWSLVDGVGVGDAPGGMWRFANIGIRSGQTIRGENTMIGPPIEVTQGAPSSAVSGPVFQIGLPTPTDPLSGLPGSVAPPVATLWHLTGFVINGDREHQTVLNQGIKIAGATDATLINAASPIQLTTPGSMQDIRNRVSFCEIVNMTGDGMEITGRGASDYANIRVHACRGYGVYVNTYDNTFENFDIGRCGKSGLVVESQYGATNGFSNFRSWSNGVRSDTFEVVAITDAALDSLAAHYYPTGGASGGPATGADLAPDQRRLMEYKYINGDAPTSTPAHVPGNGGPWTQEFEGYDYDIRGNGNFFMNMRGQNAHSHSMVMSGKRNIWWGSLSQNGASGRRWYQHKSFLALDTLRSPEFNEIHLTVLDADPSHSDFLLAVMGDTAAANNAIYLNVPADTSTNTGGQGSNQVATTGVDVTCTAFTTVTFAAAPGDGDTLTIGPVATSSGASVSGATLRLGAVTTGAFAVGQIVTGAGIKAGSTIVSGRGSEWTLSESSTATGPVDVTASATYTFKTKVAAKGQVKISGTTGTATNLARAINKSGGTSGSGGDYFVQLQNQMVKATASAANVQLTARTKGPAGSVIKFEDAGPLTYRTGLLAGFSTETMLGFTGLPAVGDTVSIGQKKYSFQAKLTGPYQVKIGADPAEMAANLAKAVNASGTAGVEYSSGTAINDMASASNTAGSPVVVLDGLGIPGGSGIAVAAATGPGNPQGAIGSTPPVSGNIVFSDMSTGAAASYSPSSGSNNMADPAYKNTLWINEVKIFGP
jgi:hypothetical protein